jgi:hypothetical protein
MSAAEIGTERPPLRLHCLGGRSPSPEIVADLLQVLALPAPAQERLWDVLGPSLFDPIPREVEARIGAFVRAYGAASEPLTRALRASRVLIREAAARNLGRDKLAEDLVAVAGGAPDLARIVLADYERGKADVQLEAARRTVAEHGKVLESFKWRLDVLSASDRGRGLKLPVVTLTLHYREGDRTDSLTVQVLPDLLKQLRGVCDRILGKR